MPERSPWFHEPDRARLRAERLGRAIQERRAELGLGRPDLARRAGLSYPYVAELETGRKQGSPSALHALASALDLDAHELLARAERGPEPGEPEAEPPSMLRVLSEALPLSRHEPLAADDRAPSLGWADPPTGRGREERLYGLKEVAAEIGVQPATLTRWQSRGTNAMPPPNQRLSAGPVWFASRIEPWIAERRRRSELPEADVEALVRRTARRAFRLAAVVHEDAPRGGPVYRRGAELTALEDELAWLVRSGDATIGSLLTPLGAVAGAIAEIGRLIEAIPEEARASRSARPLPPDAERAIAGVREALGSGILSWLPQLLSWVERNPPRAGSA